MSHTAAGYQHNWLSQRAHLVLLAIHSTPSTVHVAKEPRNALRNLLTLFLTMQCHVWMTFWNDLVSSAPKQVHLQSHCKYTKKNCVALCKELNHVVHFFFDWLFFPHLHINNLQGCFRVKLAFTHLLCVWSLLSSLDLSRLPSRYRIQ